VVAFFSLLVSVARAQDAQLEAKIVDVDGSTGRVVSERESLAGADGRAFSPVAVGWRFIVLASLDGWIPTSIVPVQPAGPGGAILPTLQICLNKLPEEVLPESLESRQ
jgi:hypothetical protein